MISFPDGYFEDEVREGFYISSLMKRCWAAQLEILSDIAHICEKYNIKWFVDCGTLLGAIRHGGFIPWDDDLDICMLREDYMRFIEVAEEELKNIWKGYKLLNFRNGEYWEMISRVVDKDAVNFDDDRVKKFHGFPLEAGVDIFPLDYLSEDQKKEDDRIEIGNAIFSLAYSEAVNDPDEGMRSRLKEIEQATGYIFDNGSPNQLQLWHLGERLFMMYEREQASKVALMGFWLKDKSHSYPLRWFEHTVMMPFENILVPVPIGYDGILQGEYGDYMCIVKTGGAHNYPRYEKQTNEFNEEMGEESPFHKDLDYLDIPYDNNTRLREQITGLESYIGEFVLALGDACGVFRESISDGKYKDISVLAESCQVAAIQVGEYIEKSFPRSQGIVRILEQYCEITYQIHESVEKEDPNNKEIALLFDRMEKIPQMIRQEIEGIKKRKVVVFVVSRGRYWHFLESTYQRCIEDPLNEVYVVPVPYYDRYPGGDIGERHYEGEIFATRVPITDYEEFDLAMILPDVIYIQDPFDRDNYSSVIHPGFFASKLKDQTSELIYVCPYVTDEIREDEGRAYKVMGDYAITAGVVYADKVYVQSENIKSLYVRKLVEHFGEETRESWEKKIYIGDSDIYTLDMCDDARYAQIPEDWKNMIRTDSDSHKKVVLYYTDISFMYEYGDEAVDKIKRALDIFADNRAEIVLIWHADPEIDEVMPEIDKGLYMRFRALRDDYIRSGIGICDMSGDLRRVITIADAFYGDPGWLANMCRNKGLPVMLQNVQV